MSPEMPMSVELALVAAIVLLVVRPGMNSSRSGGDDGRYGSVGGGTTKNPIE